MSKVYRVSIVVPNIQVIHGMIKSIHSDGSVSIIVKRPNARRCYDTYYFPKRQLVKVHGRVGHKGHVIVKVKNSKIDIFEAKHFKSRGPDWMEFLTVDDEPVSALTKYITISSEEVISVPREPMEPKKKPIPNKPHIDLLKKDPDRTEKGKDIESPKSSPLNVSESEDW
jgi:hypothetical protein